MTCKVTMKIYHSVFNDLICLFIIFFIGCATAEKTKTNKYNNCFDPYSDRKVSITECYHLEVAYLINKEWDFHPTSQCDKNDVTSVIITINRNGLLKEISYTDRSKCEGLDDYAYKAVINANPFKPFPNEMEVDEVKLGFRFSPREENR